jgi:hypothetical protein
MRDIRRVNERKRERKWKGRLNNTNQYENIYDQRKREKEKKRIFIRFCSSRQTRTMMMSFFQANEHDTSCWESRKINNRFHQMNWKRIREWERNSILRWPLYRNNNNNSIPSSQIKLISVICIQAEFFKYASTPFHSL